LGDKEELASDRSCGERVMLREMNNDSEAGGSLGMDICLASRKKNSV